MFVATGIVCMSHRRSNIMSFGSPGLAPTGVTEEQQHVHLATADHGSDLLGTAAASRIQRAHRQTGGIMDDFAGHARGDQVILRQNAHIGSAELSHQFLAGIVGNQGNSHG